MERFKETVSHKNRGLTRRRMKMIETKANRSQSTPYSPYSPHSPIFIEDGENLGEKPGSGKLFLMFLFSLHC
jgi:hypothetical protein